MSNPTTAMTQEPKITLTHSERFTNKVLKEFGAAAGEIQVTDYQRQLVQGYFIGIDRALAIAEENRVRKNKSNSDHSYDNDLPVTWENVNLKDLALDVVHYARMGLDMMQPNHLSAIPYKNKKTQKYDVTLMQGYNGIKYIAEKYALDPPLDVTTELVYSTDNFRPIKKSVNQPVEAYEFEVINPFDRGEIKGGFGYIQFSDPTKNKLITMSMKDIEKRKPRYAAAEFWGGKTKQWENGKQVEVELEGWLDEMCLKTIKREVFSTKNIPIDPKKVDDNYHYMRMREAQIADIVAQAEIAEKANAIPVDFKNIDDPEPPELPAPEREQPKPPAEPEPTPKEEAPGTPPAGAGVPNF